MTRKGVPNFFLKKSITNDHSNAEYFLSQSLHPRCSDIVFVSSFIGCGVEAKNVYTMVPAALNLYVA